jgi:hypothetical protein
MSIDSYGAKLTKRDVTELAQASEQLVVVADMIRMSGVKWAEVAVNLLIVVNNTVVRIQTKGAAAFGRYLQKHPLETPKEEPAEAKPGEGANQAPKSTSDEPED